LPVAAGGAPAPAAAEEELVDEVAEHIAGRYVH
jgi:hypothetical protein